MSARTLLDGQALDGGLRRAGTHGDAHLVAARDQQAGHVGADEAGRTGDERA